MSSAASRAIELSKKILDAADTGHAQRRMTDGRQYKSRWLLMIASVLLISALQAITQAAEPRPIDGISDNSFLIEEAYNQEQGEVQHVFNAGYTNDPRRRGWSFNFAQEWWLFSEHHQVSYSIPFYRLREEGESQRGIGDLLLEYRY